VEAPIRRLEASKHSLVNLVLSEPKRVESRSISLVILIHAAGSFQSFCFRDSAGEIEKLKNAWRIMPLNNCGASVCFSL
jgi:hypothetical protein